jgi:putative transposase
MLAKVLSANWQRCRVHFIRNALAHVGGKLRQMVAAAIRTAFTQETSAAAHRRGPHLPRHSHNTRSAPMTAAM